MNNILLNVVMASLLYGCLWHRIPEPLQVEYDWDHSAKPIHPLRADAVKAAGRVVEYGLQNGFYEPRCDYSTRAYEVDVFETDGAFEVLLVRRPAWCHPGNDLLVPPMGNDIDEVPLRYAVRRSDLRLLRERRRGDSFLSQGKLYTSEDTPDETVEYEKQWALLVEQWKERFSTLSLPAQEAFHKLQIVPGMAQGELKLLAEYQIATKARFELHMVGVREELGRGKQELWRFCKPSCWRQELSQQVTVGNGVVISVQTGNVEPGNPGER